MSTVTFTRSSSAASHHAIVLPIEMPSVATRSRIHVGPIDQEVERPQAVVDHHAPEHLALPQHGLERVFFRRVAALAEDPVVDAERDVAAVGQRLRVRRRLQVAAAVDELLLADRVAAAVRVVEEHGRRAARRVARPRDERRHRLDAVQVEDPALEDVAVPLLLADLVLADGPMPVRQLAEQPVQLAAPGGGNGRRGRDGAPCAASAADSSGDTVPSASSSRRGMRDGRIPLMIPRRGGGRHATADVYQAAGCGLQASLAVRPAGPTGRSLQAVAWSLAS